MTNVDNTPLVPNAKRLLWAGFMAILAAGVGFAIRGGIFANWGAEFGFTGAQLGEIGGAGFTGFCFGIIIGGVIADKIGYGKLVIAAFAFHILSAVITFAATPEMGKEAAFACLKWGMFVFALANGTLEAVANPLVATLFPSNRTHYLNILHASWPAGMVLGALAGWVFGDGMHWGWKAQLALYLVPTVIYGVMFFGQHFPKSEASVKGISLGDMFKDVGILGGLVVCALLTMFFKNALNLDTQTAYVIGGILLVLLGIITKQLGQISIERFGILISCIVLAIFLQQAMNLQGSAALALTLGLLASLAFTLGSSVGALLLFVLFVTHALVGAVELGTDGWIQNITGNILSPSQGKWLFIFTSLVMFSLRFCAHFIEKTLKISPVGILFICSVLACIGLNLTSRINGFGMAFLALGVYALGKTFFWPTMLAVTSDRFPRTGAIAISIMGGIGMMSAGLVGSAGLGYAKDRYAGEALKQTDSAIFETYKADKPSSFLVFADATGLDGKKLGGVQSTLSEARSLLEKGGVEKVEKELDESSKKLEKSQQELDARKQQLSASQRETQDVLDNLAKAGKREWDREVQQVMEQKEKLDKRAKQLAADIEKQASQVTALADHRKASAAMKAKLQEAGVLKEGADLNAAQAALTPSEQAVQRASITGDRKTLKADSLIPATMAVIYLLLLIYFKSIGGYKPVHIYTGDKKRKEPAPVG